MTSKVPPRPVVGVLANLSTDLSTDLSMDGASETSITPRSIKFLALTPFVDS